MTDGTAVRQNNQEHLLDHVADRVRVLPASDRGRVTTMCTQPVGDESIDMSWQFVPPRGTTVRGERAEADQDRHATKHGACGVPVLDQPSDVPLDRLPDPRSPNAIDGVRSNKVALQHGNLRSVFERIEVAPPKAQRGYVPGNEGETPRRHIIDASGHITPSGTKPDSAYPVNSAAYNIL